MENHQSSIVRILYVIDTLEVGGSERSLLQIARRLNRDRYELVVCSLYRGTALRREFEAAGIRVIALELSGKYQFLKAFLKLRRVVRSERPDLIHTTLFRADQLGRAVGRWLGIPVVSSFVNLSYDPSRSEGNPHVDGRKLAGLRMLDAFSARWVTRFHSVSAAVRDANCRDLKVDPQRVTVVPRGREIDDFSMTSTQQIAALRLSLGIGDVFPCIVNVGRLVDQKAQRCLVQAMAAVVAEYPQAKLLIAGEGRLRGRLEMQIQQLGLQKNVALLGYRNDIPQLLQIADCFVFPSIYEGLPGSVVEAMLSECAIVATDIPVLREVLASGQTGLLVPAKNAPALAGAIVRLAKDRELANRLADNARSVACQRFDIRQVVEQTEQMYRQVLQESQRTSQKLVAHRVAS